MTAEELAALAGAAAQQPAPPPIDLRDLATRAAQGGVSVNREAAGELGENIAVVGRGVADGATFGFADEITGVAGGAFGERRNANTFTDRYTASRDANREQAEVDRAENPGMRLMGQALGGSAVGIGTAGLIDDALRIVPGLRNAGLVGNVGRGSLAGAIEGGLYGFGSGEGGFDERFNQTLEYGALGGAAGAAIPVAGELTRRFALRPLGGILGVGNESRASNMVARTLDESGLGPDDVDGLLRAAADDGQDMFVAADALGNAGQRTLAGVANTPGAARELVTAPLDARQNNATDRIAAFLSDTVDASNTRAQQEAADALSRGQTANLNYGLVRQNAAPVDVRRVVQAIDDRIGPMRNTTIEGDSIDAVLDGYRRRLTGVLNEGGESLPAEMSDINRLVGFYGELSDAEQVARRAGANNRASAIARVRNALGEALEEASPDWRTANANFAAQSRVVDASTDGRRANTGQSRSADVADEWNSIEDRINRIPGLTDEQRAQYIEDARQSYRVGYAERDLAALENMRTDTRNVAAPFNNTRQRENYGLLSDDADRFFRQVDRENTMSGTRYQATGGSNTSRNLADSDAVDGADVGILASILANRQGDAAGQIARRVYQVAGGQNDATRLSIARTLMSSEPGAIARALEASQRTEATRRIVEGMLRGSARGPIDQIAR